MKIRFTLSLNEKSYQNENRKRKAATWRLIIESFLHAKANCKKKLWSLKIRELLKESGWVESD